MSRRRLILIGIIVSCAVFIILAAMEVFKPPQPKPNDEARSPTPPGIKQPGKDPTPPPPGGAGETVITDAEYPFFGKDGTREYVVKAKKAIEQVLGAKGAGVKLENPEIRIFKQISRKKGEPGIITIVAKEGTYNPDTMFAELQEDIVVHVDSETVIRTKALSFIPRKNKVFTEERIELEGKDLTVRGVGLEGDLSTEVVCVKKDVKVVVRGTEGFSLKKHGQEETGDKKDGKDEKKGKLAELDEPITITSKKELVFRLSKETGHRATFHENVVATKGKSKLTADKLEITFTEDAGAVKKVIASGNADFKDKDVSGKADKIVWEAEKESVTLISSKEMSKVSQGPNQLEAKTIFLFQAKEEMRVDGIGRLKIQTKSGLNPDEKKGKEAGPKMIEVLWEKDMLYHANQAVFRGNVKVIEEGGMGLDAETLTVTFGKEGGKIEKIVAEKNVVLRDEGRTAKGERLEWDAAEGAGVLTSGNTVTVTDADSQITAKTLRFFQADDRIKAEGAGFLARKKTEKDGKKGEAIHVIWEQEMEFDRKNHRATFLKNVEAVREEAKLCAQKLEILFDDQNKEVKKIVATKEVTIEQDKQTGKGEKAVYDAATEEAVLYGGTEFAEIRQEGNRFVKAPVIYLSQKTESIRTENGGHLVFKTEAKKGKKAEDVNVTWVGTMNFNPERHKATFTKDVCAQRGGRKINADQVDVFFDDKNREVRNIVAQGHVDLTEGGRKGKGDLFSWDSVTGKVELEGKPAVMETREGFRIQSSVVRQFQNEDRMEAEGAGNLEFNNPHKKLDNDKKPGEKIRVVWRDRLIFPRREGKATFYGDVVVTSGTRRLEMERLEIYLDEKDEPKEMRAYEHVVVSDTPRDAKGLEREPQEGTGDKLTWVAQSDTAVLSGKPANLYHAGSLVGSGPKLSFVGFFAGDSGERRVRIKTERGPGIIRIPETVNSPSQ